MGHRHEHSTFIDALGPKILGYAFSLTPQRLHNWRTRGVPVSMRVPVARLAIENGIAPPTDFLEPIRTGDWRSQPAAPEVADEARAA